MRARLHAVAACMTDMGSIAERQKFSRRKAKPPCRFRGSVSAPVEHVQQVAMFAEAVVTNTALIYEERQYPIRVLVICNE
jgi:hypothetical protein